MTSKTKILIGFFLLFLACAWAQVRVNNEAIWNSTLDNTVIGGTSAAAGNFSNVIANAIGTNSIVVGGTRSGGYAGASGGFLAFNQAGAGDMDFVATNGGSSPSFYWYYLLGTNIFPEMWLDQSAAALHVPGGFVGNLTGNASSSTVSSSTTGNAATATQFASTPSNCGNGNPAYGVGVNGNALCPSTYKVQSAILTSGICTTNNTAYSTCGPITLNWTSAFIDANYGVSCNTNVPSSTTGGSTIGTLSIYIYARNTSNVQVELQNGASSGAGANTASFISCTGVHS